jgi:hypothetical protein
MFFRNLNVVVNTRTFHLILLLILITGCNQQDGSGDSGTNDDAFQSSDLGSDSTNFNSQASPSQAVGSPDIGTLENQLRDFANETLKKSSGYKQYTNWSEPIIRIERSIELSYPYHGRLQWTNSGPNTLRRRFLYEASSQQWRVGKWYDDGSGEDAFTAGVQRDFDF